MKSIPLLFLTPLTRSGLRRFQLAFFLCLLAGTTLAQTISGRVTSAEDQQPLPGVSILIKGSTTGTTTREDGTYSLNVSNPASATLAFSFIGYDNQDVTVGSRSVINIGMRVGTANLNEVVVTALGIKKDIRQTGVTVQTVDGAQLLKAREPNPINSLTGKVAGLTIGSSAELLGRPNISLRGNSDVLFVVDGIPITSDTGTSAPMILIRIRY